MKQGRAGKETTFYKVAHPSTKAVDPGGADQLGQAMPDRMRQGHHVPGNPADQLFKGKGYEGPKPPAQGVGPGGGRTVHKSGSQGRH